MKNVIAYTAAACALASAAPAFAQDTSEPKPIELHGSVTLTSDYRFRGVSQSNRGFAVQGGITAKHKSGIYAGTWASNLSGWGTFGGSNTELDLFGGYSTAVGPVTVDVGLTWYMYPGGSPLTDFAEPYVKVSGAYGPVNLLAGVAYAPKQTALADFTVTPRKSQDNLYLWLDGNTAIPSTPVTAKAHIGYSKGNPGLGPNATSVAPSGEYFDWSLGADVAVGPVTLGVAYIDTDITAGQIANLATLGGATYSPKGESIAGSKVVFSITGAF